MKQKLAKFTEFAENLFPHEVYYLSRIENFQTPENKGIFEVILYNLDHRADPRAFDESIDKRKYSNLKKWIDEKLNEADVDHQLRVIQELEAKVLLDQVDKRTENEIQKWLQRGVPSHYYFRKIYELAQHYEHFLLIRLRENAGAKVGAYLDQYRANFEYAQEVFNKLQQATSDIISEYRNRSETHLGWEDFLTRVVYSENIDGMNQYSAFIRLSLLYSNRGDYHKLEGLYNYIDDRFVEGRYYSKRILANYYANRLLYTSRFNSLDEAEQFGYLSIKYKNADYLFYLTNLAAVLIRQGKSERALGLLREAFPEMRQTNSLHNKVGFIAFYIKCMVDIGRVKEAEAFADSYLKAYPKQVMNGRWHLFFVAYFRSLMIQEKYGRLLYLDHHFKIESLDRANRSSHSYLPTISWYISIARFVEHGGDPDSLIADMKSALRGVELSGKRAERVKRIYDELMEVAPQVLKKGKSAIFDEVLEV
ncbi:MAG: tetratricopeptide repeat protein [Bacteroidetes bacterium]|nr:MAG: tetratricopeptide repeat protein [Bacteroidota bacterium]